ncbi:MAG: hypothetical protein ACI9TZ_003542, partial [Yoonia sp.]
LSTPMTELDSQARYRVIIVSSNIKPKDFRQILGV